MRVNALPALLAVAWLTGCQGEDAQVLRSWEGVYRIDRVTQNDEGCATEGPERDPGYGFFEIVTEPGVDADLVDLRACASKTDCERVGFITFLAFNVGKAEMVGTRDEVFFAALGDDGNGLCQVLHEDISLVRDGKSVRVDIESGIASDVIAESDAVCVELLETLADDPEGCDAYRVYEGVKVD